MAGRKPADAVKAFVRPLQDAISCFVKGGKTTADSYDPEESGVLVLNRSEVVKLPVRDVGAAAPAPRPPLPVPGKATTARVYGGRMVIAAILLGVAILVLATWIRMGPRGRERYRRTYRGRRAQSIKETGGSTAL